MRYRIIVEDDFPKKPLQPALARFKLCLAIKSQGHLRQVDVFLPHQRQQYADKTIQAALAPAQMSL